MTEGPDWLGRLFPADAELLDWSACAPRVLPGAAPGTITLLGALKFSEVDVAVEAEIDAVRDGAGWTATAVRLAPDAGWEDSAWNAPERDPRASSDAKDRVPRIRLLARLNLFLLEVPCAYRPEYVGPLHREGQVDFEAVGTGGLNDALQDALRDI
ncbi:hypothetical protein ACIQWR_37750 [Streptomyces sp. NPDC098789]|uniref:hypothetical protein n=1 Tax=Streptomyces sp. NPDC098789 TaxID=3366098 RepID=UPI0038099BC2